MQENQHDSIKIPEKTFYVCFKICIFVVTLIESTSILINSV